MARKKKKTNRRGPAPLPARSYGVSAFGIYGVGGYYGGYPGWGGSGTAQSPLSGDQFGGVGEGDSGGDGGGGSV